MVNWWILTIFDAFIFFIVMLTVIYITFFAFYSLSNKHTNIPKAKYQNRFIILIPAYRQDKVIEQTVQAVLGQSYPQRCFNIVVISDHQEELTNFRLAQYPITLLTPDFEKSTKAKSLQFALKNLPQFKIYDVVLILDADNLVAPDFLERMNDAYEMAGTKAILAHRMSKNRDTSMARLDSIFEEINNSIFRRGHVAAGLSAAITGSGIALDFEWFKNNITKSRTAWEDKEIEAMLMRQGIYVDYFDDIILYDEKTRQADDFNRQRSRWASSQLHTMFSNVRFLPAAIFHKQYDWADKIIQWMLIPRTILVAIIVLMSIILPFVYLSMAIKWWLLAAFVLLIYAIAVPDYLVDDRWDKDFLKAPIIILSALWHLLPIARKKRFININKSIKKQ